MRIQRSARATLATVADVVREQRDRPARGGRGRSGGRPCRRVADRGVSPQGRIRAPARPPGSRTTIAGRHSVTSGTGNRTTDVTEIGQEMQVLA